MVPQTNGLCVASRIMKAATQNLSIRFTDPRFAIPVLGKRTRPVEVGDEGVPAGKDSIDNQRPYEGLLRAPRSMTSKSNIAFWYIQDTQHSTNKIRRSSPQKSSPSERMTPHLLSVPVGPRRLVKHLRSWGLSLRDLSGSEDIGAVGLINTVCVGTCADLITLCSCFNWQYGMQPIHCLYGCQFKGHLQAVNSACTLAILVLHSSYLKAYDPLPDLIQV